MRKSKRSDGGTWAASEILRIVPEASLLGEKEGGAFPRRVGLRKAPLNEWIETAAAALTTFQ